MNPLAIWKAASLLQRIGVGVGLVITLFGAWQLFWWQHDSGVIREHEAEREAIAAPAREAASNQRAADTVTNTANEKDLHNAIDQAPKGGQLSPAALALNCERLRKAGRVPPACGRSSSDGSQAPAK